MRIKVKIDDIEVEVDRPKFIDYNYVTTKENDTINRTNIMNDSILPILQEVIIQAKELYNLRNNG